MKKLKNLAFILLAGVVMSSCKSLTFTQTSPLPMPQSLTGLFYLTPDHDGNNMNNLQDLPGRLIVFYLDSGKLKYDLTLDKFIDSATGKVRAIDKPIIQYQSILDKTASASLSFVLGNVDLSGENSYQMIITDASGVVLDNNDKQRAVIEKADIRKDAVKVLYITGASLYTFEYKSYVTSQNNDALSGYAINLGGKYSYSDSEFALDYKIAVDVYDVTYYNFQNPISTPENTTVKAKIGLSSNIIVQSVHDNAVFFKKSDPATNKQVLEKISDSELIKAVNKYSLLDLQKAVNRSPKSFTNIINKKNN